MSVSLRLTVGVITMAVVVGVSAHGQPGRAKGFAPTAEAKNATWTSDDVFQRLTRFPNDPYLQYVAVQLARREQRLDQFQFQIWAISRRNADRRPTDLFSTFTGALAVQESLQLDTLIGDDDARGRGGIRFTTPIEEKAPAPGPVEKSDEKPGVPESPEPKAVQKGNRPRLRDIAKAMKPTNVSVDQITGPTIKSHPWETMLAGRKPEVGTLSKCVPEDYYLAEFKSVQSMMQALAVGDVWGDHLLTQMMGQANSQDTERRIKKQLGIAGVPPAVLDAMGVEGIGVTGSDLYLADGSDITLLVQVKQIVALRQWADGMLKGGANVKREEGKFLDVAYTHSFTPDGEVNVYTADPRPDLHLRSNSLPAFRRVLEATAGKTEDGKAVRRLGDAAEYAYIRTILPRGAAEEDGLIYLSDPCIRRLVGPRVKLGQRRRLIAFNHLKMIEHAALMFRTENGRAPKTFEELAQKGCAPGVFGQGKLACPAGGTYTLSADGMSATSSIYGRPGQLAALLDIPISTVSQDEATIYKVFLDEYNQYWRTFFDPIAVRVKVSPQQYRLETVILPLIDNSIYTGMAMALGDKPATLDSGTGSKKAIMSVAAKLNKQPLLDQLPPDPSEVKEAKEPKPGEDPKALAKSASSLRQIILALHSYHDANNGAFPPATLRSKDGKPLLSWRVAVLPYVEGGYEAYSSLKMDEPWDSEHNKKQIAKVPLVYRGRNPKLAAEGKTPFLAPIGEHTIFPPDGKKMGIRNMIDGTSQTIALVEATDDKAVIWTKPDDLEVDWAKPHTGLVGPGRDSFLVAMGDGTARHIRATIPADTLKAMFTCDGNELIGDLEGHTLGTPGDPGRRASPFPFFGNIDELPRLRRFLRDGIGEQIAIHIHDAAQPIAAEVTGLFGATNTLMGFGGRMGGPMELAMIGLLAQGLTNPVCVSVPVKDAKVVDEFLVELDRLYATTISKEMGRDFRPEYYTFDWRKQTMRCLAFKIFGLSLRVCWGRIGNQLVIVNHPSVLDTIAETPAGNSTAVTGHAMLRVRPENWNAVLPVYQLGWAEGQRNSCQVNQQRIAAVAGGWQDALKADGEISPELLQRVTQLYGVRPYCPDGGRFSMTKPGTECACSIHGGWNNPRQLTAPAEDSATAKTVRSFNGMTATLTFLEDGLHAVVTINRK
jgi:Protein of unknown function (DUF1559)